MATMPDVFTDSHTTEPVKGKAASPSKVTIMQEKPSKPHLFTTFCPKPIGVTFQHQEPDEEIILLLRRHFVTNLGWIVTALFFFILPPLLMPLFLSDAFTALFPPIPSEYTLVLILLYYLVLVGYVISQFATWFYQVGIITPLRVVDVDFHSLLSRSIAYTEIEGIVDVEVLQGGFLQGLFNYGTVDVQTEGIEANFEFTKIPNPTAVADTISDLMRETKRND